MNNSENIISNTTLLKTFVTNAMENYFYTKLKNEPTDYVKLKICELLKFLIISHHSFGNIPFDNEIDELWHLWILQTVQYQELMEKLPTKNFIHHSSNDYSDGSIENDPEVEAHRNFSYLVSYVQNFGDFTKQSVKFWPMAEKLMNALATDLMGLNKYLKDSAAEEISN